VKRVLVHGGGKMGRRLVAVLGSSGTFELAGVVCEPRPEALPESLWHPSLPESANGIDLVVDFTLTGGPAVVAAWCGQHGVPLLSGTTALSDADRAGLESASQSVPVLWAPNLSFGIALMKKLLRQAVSALGREADIHITEKHHVHKQDAPSGTALALADTARQARSPDAGEITFTSLREGEVVGEHTAWRVEGRCLARAATFRVLHRRGLARPRLIATSFTDRSYNIAGLMWERTLHAVAIAARGQSTGSANRDLKVAPTNWPPDCRQGLDTRRGIQ
jgi:4-hydroxy-tetrahydrodipicolinate reductase